jgi:hypothetical protein
VLSVGTELIEVQRMGKPDGKKEMGELNRDGVLGEMYGDGIT